MPLSYQLFEFHGIIYWNYEIMHFLIEEKTKIKKTKIKKTKIKKTKKQNKKNEKQKMKKQGC